MRIYSDKDKAIDQQTLQNLIHKTNLTGIATTLTSEEAKHWIDKARETFWEQQGSKWVLKNVVKSDDIGPISLDEASALLATYPIDPDLRVILCWRGSRRGLRLPYSKFLESFRHMWHPVVADVIILDDAMTFMLSIDHEEQVAYCLPLP